MCSSGDGTPCRVPGFPIRTAQIQTVAHTSSARFVVYHVLHRHDSPSHSPMCPGSFLFVTCASSTCSLRDFGCSRVPAAQRLHRHPRSVRSSRYFSFTLMLVRHASAEVSRPLPPRLCCLPNRLPRPSRHTDYDHHCLLVFFIFAC
jgi:hypothetical protein